MESEPGRQASASARASPEKDAAVEAPRTVLDGTAFVGGYDGRVYAVAVRRDVAVGARVRRPDQGRGDGARRDDPVVGSHAGVVRAIKTTDGPYCARLSSPPCSQLLLAGEVLVVATTAGAVHGLQAATLAPLWRKAGAPAFATPRSTCFGITATCRRGPRGLARRRRWTLFDRRQCRAGLRSSCCCRIHASRGRRPGWSGFP